MKTLSLRTEIQDIEYPITINHSHTLMLIGSCFVENISEKLALHKFRISTNPFGILFNPASIAQCINDLIYKDAFTEQELFYYNETWNSFKHHSQFSNPDKEKCLAHINATLQAHKSYIKNTHFLLITLGSSIAYRQLTNGEIVANCHKLPAAHFQKIFLSADESTQALLDSIANLKSINPSVHIIFTLSPVRYIKDNFMENSLSKAHLRIAIDKLCHSFSNVYYFPAYEIMLDDLRDYRFYDTDKIHPSDIAIDYIWQFFENSWMNAETKDVNVCLNDIHNAYMHRPNNLHSEAHIKFKETQLAKINDLMKKSPYLDFTKEINYFSTK